ncbi:STAS domain-containing protein [Fictibacillus terranigra]|uniref:STAS domain-containing protein n=1 Tax=Fictibacillus terranigra TaxID=3058424 RepID=A0ABT8E8N7_9BACL|nr:STAS domain-containing protein [Fictibacillus sp. CENA-BCM004]MDN4074260.1 STAS domain-containing protein [Fictibacillus sp. CENA-BCM004]
MDKNQELHQFLLNKARNLTEEWYDSLDKSNSTGVYRSNDPEVIKTLKEQNYEFHIHLCDVLVKDEGAFFNEFDKWIIKIAKDSEHLKTPIHYIIKEFMRVREQYLNYISEFVSNNPEEIKPSQIEKWNRLMVKAFDSVMLQFIEETHKYSTHRLNAQQELLNELSSPVISLNNDMALLPLVGDIDTARAKFILENTLNQCVQKGIGRLFIDLSGVVMIDTMVAHEIFQLIDALDLVGVKTTLSGIRPEIAATAVQLGLSFDRVSITSTLAQAMDFNTARKQNNN